MAIVVVGMLDEREEALTIILDRIRQRGHRTCLIDISVGAGAIVPALQPDVTCQELAELAKERAGLAVGQGVTPNSVVTEGLKAKIHDLYGCGQLEGMVAITGMTGALISLPAMKELPFGVPKLLISGATGQPVHAAKFGDYFARRDITVMHTVVDTVGMNPLVRSLALNGADAISGMVEHYSHGNVAMGCQQDASAVGRLSSHCAYRISHRLECFGVSHNERNGIHFGDCNRHGTGGCRDK